MENKFNSIDSKKTGRDLITLTSTERKLIDELNGDIRILANEIRNYNNSSVILVYDLLNPNSFFSNLVERYLKKLNEYKSWLESVNIDWEDAADCWGQINLKRNYEELTAEEITKFNEFSSELDYWRREARIKRRPELGLRSDCEETGFTISDSWSEVAYYRYREIINKRIDWVREGHIDEESLCETLLEEYEIEKNILENRI